MNKATLRLVLLLSCCHAMVHVYELSFAGVEQLIGAEFTVGKDVTGMLGTCLRLPFGLCALLSGWLTHCFGTKRLLLVYLAGCSLAAGAISFSPNLPVLFVGMFALGMFASIYHPAGVSLISHQTNPENRPMALGYHGILGSTGIASAPFLAAVVLATSANWRWSCLSASWRWYYLVLTIPGLLLAALLWLRLPHQQPEASAADSPVPPTAGEDDASWVSYFTLTAMVSLAGFVYAALLTFMQRYLDGAQLSIAGIRPESLRNYLTGMVLMLGILGQYTGGRIARPRTLEPLMAAAFLGAAPFVLWMGFAAGMERLWAAGLFAPVFFMHQPLFNSLVAKYTPRRRRSLCYGLSFTAGFGLGSLGATFAGRVQSDLLNHATLAVMLAAAGMLALVLWRWHGPVRDAQETEQALV
jgi:predicted MFS family arabinose efflux permease